MTIDLAGKYRTLGLRGVLNTSANRFFGIPKVMTVRPKGIKHAIHLRVRTSDVSLYSDIILRDVYRIPLPSFYPRTIIDAGANCGMAAIYYANKYHGAKIVAVEPEPGNFEILKRNISPYPNITAVRAALWSSDGEVRLSPTGLDATPYGRWDFQVNGSGVPVRAITMQTLMRETGLHSIDLLKMDVEGGEQEIFADPSWSSSVKVCIIELHDHIVPGCRAAVTAAFPQHKQWDEGEMTYFVSGQKSQSQEPS